MKKLVWLTIQVIAWGMATCLYAQTKSSPEIIGKPLSDSVPSVSSKRVVPAVMKPSGNLVKNFKDLFQFNALEVGQGPQLNPRAVSFVQDYIEKYGKGLSALKEWSRPFFNMMDVVFVDHNLPCELKYLAMIESRLNPSAVSWAGAVGPWQFMPATAMRMGLKVTRSTDERTDYIKSTQAAARYLTELYNQFGDWLLVIAAYNGGAGSVLKAIKRSGSHNFWDIQYYLPAESRNHVKKFISTHYIFEGQGGLTTLTRAESDEHYGTKNASLRRNLNEQEKSVSISQLVSGKFNAAIIARNIQMDPSEFNRYNPGFDRIMSGASDSYELVLPPDKMENFNAVKYKILSESVEFLLSGATSTSFIQQPGNPTPSVLTGKIN